MLLLASLTSPLFQDTSQQRLVRKQYQKKLSSKDPGLGCLISLSTCWSVFISQGIIVSHLPLDPSPFKNLCLA